MEKRKKMMWCFSEAEKKNTSVELDNGKRSSTSALPRERSLENLSSTAARRSFGRRSSNGGGR
jgi:hypothetical protein